MSKEARYRAYCSTANLGPGFDVLAIALDAFYDEVLVRVGEGARRINISVQGPHGHKVPSSPERNSAGVAAEALLNRIGVEVEVAIDLWKGVPPGYGLGSSGASAVAVVAALNDLLEANLDQNDLIELAARGEEAVAGAAHADNVSASLLGGLVLVKSYDPLEVVPLGLPRDASFVLSMPKVEVTGRKTERARKVIPTQVPLSKSIRNVANTAAIIAGLLTGELSLAGKGMEDAIVEPARAPLVPAYHEVRKAALKAGAEGVALSGAGPSMVALVNPRKVEPDRVGEAMVSAYERIGLKASALVCRAATGARRLG